MGTILQKVDDKNYVQQMISLMYKRADNADEANRLGLAMAMGLVPSCQVMKNLHKRNYLSHSISWIYQTPLYLAGLCTFWVKTLWHCFHSALEVNHWLIVQIWAVTGCICSSWYSFGKAAKIMSHSHPQENLLQVHGIVVIVNIRIQISWKQIVYENHFRSISLGFRNRISSSKSFFLQDVDTLFCSFSSIVLMKTLTLMSFFDRFLSYSTKHQSTRDLLNVVVALAQMYGYIASYAPLRAIEARIDTLVVRRQVVFSHLFPLTGSICQANILKTY